ncbi:MAG: type II toxin-antitoxin system RelE/ParE family toxin [Parcubacteria group bacterium]|nr:type II toxin-antitoxin system RelE/ParE family toxin [Parcubacteria group bacterium]
MSYVIVLAPRFNEILKKLKARNPVLLTRLEKQISKVVREPILGKPLRNVLRNYRRVQVDSFVLVYEIKGLEIRLLDFDHHDRIYSKSWLLK